MREPERAEADAVDRILVDAYRRSWDAGHYAAANLPDQPRRRG